MKDAKRSVFESIQQSKYVNTQHEPAAIFDISILDPWDSKADVLLASLIGNFILKLARFFHNIESVEKC